jgi:hypothetical protein
MPEWLILAGGFVALAGLYALLMWLIFLPLPDDN